MTDIATPAPERSPQPVYGDHRAAALDIAQRLRILARPRPAVYLGSRQHGELYGGRVGQPCEIVSVRAGVPYPLTLRFRDGFLGIARADMVRAKA